MIWKIDQASEVPIYQQLRNCAVAAIAAGELRPGDQLPSVRSLGCDLGVNLHTVNKAYALLRDEGYVLMRGRAGAVVAEPALSDGGDAGAGIGRVRAAKRLADGLMLLTLEYKAAGGPRAEFERSVARVLADVYGTGAGARADGDAPE